MKIPIIKPLILLLLLVGCNKTEVVEFNQNGTLKGQVQTRTEWGELKKDHSDIVIQLEGSNPLLTTVTDFDGKFEITNIPTSTYNLVVSKNGYGEYQHQGFQIVGGNEPLYWNNYLIETSTIVVDDFSAEVVHDQIKLKATISHLSAPTSYIPSIRFFFHNENNPSAQKYLYIRSVNVENDSQIEVTVEPDKKKFPSGSRIYIIAYGLYYLRGYFDIPSNLDIFTGVGKGSDIIEIVAP